MDYFSGESELEFCHVGQGQTQAESSAGSVERVCMYTLGVVLDIQIYKIACMYHMDVRIQYRVHTYYAYDT